MIKGTKHILCECKCRFDGRKCNSDQWWNTAKCQCECRKHHVCEKDYVSNPVTRNCENGKYLSSIMDDSAMTSDTFIESYHKEKNFNEKKAPCKRQNFCILLAFLLIILGLFTAVISYCYLIKYWTK